MTKKHVCIEDDTCTCSMQATEPDENCPVHALGPWPPRCGECGRFIKRESVSVEEIDWPGGGWV